MIALKRVTADYIRAEDRVRLTAETDRGGVVRLWLVRPLLDLILPHAIKWTEQNAPLPRSGPAVDPTVRKVMQEFAQDRALAAMQGQAAVQGAPAQEWLVETIDFAAHGQAVNLTFKPGVAAAGIEPATLTLLPEPMRQWLQALYMHYRVAGWAQTIWPAWVVDAAPAAAGAPAPKAN
jgi:hypothetical protein